MSVHTANLAESLRRAIETGNFESALHLAEEYGRAARAEIDAASPEKRATLAEETRAFLESRLHLARVMRAHIGTQLRQATGLASYQEAVGAGNTWTIEG